MAVVFVEYGVVKDEIAVFTYLDVVFDFFSDKLWGKSVISQVAVYAVVT